MSHQQRLSAILELLTEQGSLQIEDIVERFGVSPATARRDVNHLAEQRLVTRTHGGVVASGTSYELPLQYKIARNAEAKVAIAEAARSLVSQGDVVGLTGGTTTSELARALARHSAFEGDSARPGLTIVTNALNIGYEMTIRPQIKIVLTGGVARPQTFELVGPLVADTIGGLALDWAFLGVNGIDAKFGATTNDESEAEVNRLLARAAKKVGIVADSSKLGTVAFARVCELTEIDVLITDAEPPHAISAALNRAGAEVLVAMPPNRAGLNVTET